MFTQRCFIRINTKELVDMLKELGYNPYYSARNNYGNSLQTCCHDSRGAVYWYEDVIDNDSDDLAGSINCGTNEELFLAIAALRDDYDKFQWFTNGKEWIQCEKEDWIDEISSLCVGGNYNYDENGELSVDFHKATVEELIEHFK